MKFSIRTSQLLGSYFLSCRITVQHHSAWLVMPNSYSCDEVFNLHLTTIIDSYILSWGITIQHHSAWLVMPDRYSCDEVFNLLLTTIKDYYTVFSEYSILNAIIMLCQHDSCMLDMGLNHLGGKIQSWFKALSLTIKYTIKNHNLSLREGWALIRGYSIWRLHKIPMSI